KLVRLFNSQSASTASMYCELILSAGGGSGSYLGILCQMNDCLFLVVNGTGQSLRSWSGGQLPFWLTCVSVQNASSTALQIIAKNGR
ncbi:MAG: hypothetical protein TR69_WS6001000368, partial [candidate division WS6 bacterium OLB20]